MKLKNVVIMLMLLFVDLSSQQQWDTSEITGYQFHTYFIQDNEDSIKEALTFRESIQELSDTFLAGCRLNRVNYVPIGPHIIGSYETCCNSSSLIQAQSFFMQNRGNLSVLLRPLTRYEVLDHTTRAMWLGKDMPLDISTLREDLGPQYDLEAKCLPINLNEDEGADGGAYFITLSLYNVFFILVLYFILSHRSI